MKRIQNIQFTSPEADRKVMLIVSIVLMVLFWCFFAFLLTLALIQEHYAGAALLAIPVVLLIPFQLIRYVRELRRLFRGDL